MSAPRRPYQQGGPCCDGVPPIWGYPPGFNARPDWMSEAQEDAINLLNNGGIVRQRTLHAFDPAMRALREPVKGADGRYLVPPAPGFADARAALPSALLVIQAGLGHDRDGRDLGQDPRTDRVRADADGRATILWCKACEKTALEQFGEDLGHTFDAMVPVIRGIAIAASYIPVFGTAVSFVLNASVSIAQGQSIDTAFLDSLGHSLPGQPMSGMAYDGARAIMRGEPLDDVAIEVAAAGAGGVVTPEMKQGVVAAAHIARSIAEGNALTSAVLDEMYNELPGPGKAAMGTARRLLNGDDAWGAVSQEAKVAGTIALADAKAKGEAGMNRYIAEAGYQGSLNVLPGDMRTAVSAGIIAGSIENNQFVGSFGTTEKDPATVDGFVAKGRKIIAAGARWKNRLLSDILKGQKLTLTVPEFDAIMQRMTGQNRTVVHDIDDLWRRGFEAAVGKTQGSSADGPGQQQFRASLVNAHMQKGFDAGQFIQHERTTYGDATVFRPPAQDSYLSTTASSKASLLKGLFTTPSPTATVKNSLPALTVLKASQGIPTLLPAPGEPVSIPPGRTIDPALRVALANRGIALSNGDPAIRADRDAEPTDATKRGFSIATALLTDGTAATETARVRASLDPETLSGFDHGVTAFTRRKQVASMALPAPLFDSGQTSFVSRASETLASESQKNQQRAAWVSYYNSQVR